LEEVKTVRALAVETKESSLDVQQDFKRFLECGHLDLLDKFFFREVERSH
jgi:hypothetical protein